MDTPNESLQHHPTPMARFGKNEYGQNLYRIVFAPSRRYIVYGQWPDGSQKAQWLPKYPEVGSAWVLERWLTPFEYARCTPEEWNRELTILGPYPDRGEYEICHKFNLASPDDESLTKLVALIEQSHKQTRRNGAIFDNPENTVACIAEAEQREAATSSEMQALIGNALPAFGAAPMSGYGGGRSTKAPPVRLSAQEAGLPVMPRGERGRNISRSTLVAQP